MKNNVEVQESTNYESCIGVRDTTQSLTLEDIIGEEIPDPVNNTPDWKKHWKGMPDYEQKNNPPYKQIYLNFRNKEDYDVFAKLINQNLSEKTKSIWYPKLDREENALMRWIEEND
jgi:hypothetical protein